MREDAQGWACRANTASLLFPVMRVVPSPPPPWARMPRSSPRPPVYWSERLAATALAIEQARAATASTFALTRWNAGEAPGITRCPHCGLLIVGTATLELRAAVHARCCPGGDRAAEWWFPRLVRNDVPSPRPVLRLVYGGLAKQAGAVRDAVRASHFPSAGSRV